MFLISAFVFFFGLAVGSFLNAVIYRLEPIRQTQGKKSALEGRSYCPHCGHQLEWRDLIPVLSFMLLRRRCRYCKQRISIQYPFVEIATALVFLLSFKFQISSLNQISSIEILNLFYLWAIVALLVVLFVYDLKYYILPDKILFPAIGIVVGYRVFEVLGLGFAWDLGFGVSGFAAAMFFFAIFAFSKGRAMGFGDVKLAFFMGLFLGWPGILVALFFAFTTGALIGVGLIVAHHKELKSEVPFGPFLIGGVFFAFFFGRELVDWYARLLVI